MIQNWKCVIKLLWKCAEHFAASGQLVYRYYLLYASVIVLLSEGDCIELHCTLHCALHAPAEYLSG